MKIVCIGDAFITCEMMEEGIRPYLTEGDTLKTLFFGLEDKTQMRDILKDVEARRHDHIVLPEGLYEAMADADLLIVHLCPIKRHLLANSPKLKAIMSCRGGLENIDVEDATEFNIIVSNNPAHNANGVAEFTVAMILSETRNVARSNMALRNGQWRIDYPNTKTTIKEMQDLTVGIVGYGSIGRLVAYKLSVFGCKILVADPFLKECKEEYATLVPMDELLAQSDIVTLHARSNGAIMTDREFGLMKQNSYLINSARSYLVDSEAFQRAMDSGKLLGAAFDVFETEPNIPAFYLKYDNITITNHLGGLTINSFRDAPAFAIKNYLNYINGKAELAFWANKNKLA
jgi:D-3-phosphoglycerate dehydrogenase